MRCRCRMTWFFALLAVAAACRGPEYAPRRPMPKPPVVVSGDEAAPAGATVTKPPAQAPAEQPAKSGEGAAAPAGARSLVQTGTVRVEVASAEDAIAAFLVQVKGWQGYLESQSGSSLHVKVPATRFEEGFAWLRASGRVLEESRQADVLPAEQQELGIRIDNAKKARDRLLEVLPKTENVEDIVRVEAELRRLTEELEVMEGRRKALGEQVAMATLQATFEAVAAEPLLPRARKPSRFAWINALGAERIMGDF